MSGICGLIRLDGGDAEHGALAAMTGAMRRRGPDGAAHWREGPAALGHALLATTPQAVAERLPLADPRGGCVITADARLDDREALFAALGAQAPLPAAGDGELILCAWRKWGEDCVQHLLGDFAFAIWDAGKRRLFCVRDPLGMRQIVWRHEPGRLFAFATDPRAIVCLPGIVPALDEARIADCLADLEGSDATVTPYAGIARLPPGHCLNLDLAPAERGVLLRRYWTPALPPLLDLPSDEAYAEAFRAVFEVAVRDRLRCSGPVAAMLSGGCDSTAVAAVAARLLAGAGGAPLATVSIAGPDAATCEETRAIHAAVRGIAGIAPHVVDHTVMAPASTHDLAARVADADDPFDGHMVLIWAAYREARRLGARVLLDGVGGDIVLADGGCLAALIRRGHWRRAWRELAAGRAFWGETRPLWRDIARAWLGAFLPLALLRLRAGRKADSAADSDSAIDPAFAARIGLDQRIARHRRAIMPRSRCPQARRAQGIAGPHVIVGRERYDRVAAAFGIEPRDPFLDLRVVNFCLSLPADRLLRDGWPKWILRRAMAGLVPDEVRWRKGRGHLGWDVARGVLSCRVARWLAAPLAAKARLRPFVRDEALCGLLARDDEAAARQFDLWHLGQWLERQR